MRTAKPCLRTLGVLWLLPAPATAVGYLVLDKDVPPGACEGIGFGCTLSDADAVVFLAFFFGIPVLVPAGLIAVTAIAVVQAMRRRHKP